VARGWADGRRGTRFIVAGITTSDVDEHPFVGGPARPVRLVVKDGRNGVLDIGRNWVHVRVVDDATGRPVPCRVHFRSAGGIPYQPHGHHNHVTQNLGSWHYDVWR
jgi:hypothetical protein